MVFLEDIMVDFAKSKNKAVIEKNSYISGTGKSVVTLVLLGNEIWRFIGGTEVLVRGVGVRGEENSRPAMSFARTREWREFCIGKVYGIQRDTLIKQFIDDARIEFLSRVEDLTESEELCKNIDKLGDAELKHILFLEEKKVAGHLEKSKTAFDFDTIRQGILVNRAYYGRNLNQCMQRLLKNVAIGVSEGGEEVYNFTPVQYKHFERLKEIMETIDFTMRYQIYRADQREVEIQQAQQ